MTTGIVRQDAVGRVLAGWRATRAARLVRAQLEQGQLAGDHYLLYEYLPGRWPPRVSSSLLDEMIAVDGAERGAAGRPPRTGTHH